jgi:hypothetical protein
VIVTVVNWVVTTVCELVADVIDLVVSIVVGIFNIIVGIFTWDWGRVWDAIVDIFAAAVALIWDIVRTVTLGSLVGAFWDRASQWRLRNYVEGLIDGNRRFSDDERTRIKRALGITGGDGFGFRLKYTAFRGFVTSAQNQGEGTPPDLVVWNNDPNEATRVDLKILAGEESTTFFQRGRPDVDGDLDVDDYLADPASHPTFKIFAMSEGVLDDKLGAAKTVATQLGLRLKFEAQDVQLRKPSHVRMGPSDAAISAMLRDAPFSRVLGAADPAGAQRDLCAPITIASFLYTDNSFNGYSAALAGHPCVDGGSRTGSDLTGCNFRDRLPDFAFRYVPIHEIGHTFGLCHVNGLDRIMVSTKEKGILSWGLIPNYWLHGSPIFVYDEATSAWDYIIKTFSAECLATRQFD